FGGMVIAFVGTCRGRSTGFALQPARDWSPGLAYTLWRIANKGVSDWWYGLFAMCGPIFGGIIVCSLHT
ncbi:aquaporin, partial [Limosilactobacillus reuteri]